MDYNSLKYIITVHKHQSISKAAEELYLSQPNISKAIQKLEKEIGITIFNRTSRGVNTTIEGKEFIKRAQELVKKFDDFSEEFSTSTSSLFSLNIAHPQDNFYYLKIADFMSEFSRIGHHSKFTEWSPKMDSTTLFALFPSTYNVRLSHMS